jgi:pyruvate/2-oxoacid:ferredoxin oxidoreductase alpha subunit
VANTLRDVVDARRSRGERVGMIRIKMFRPFPRAEVRALCAGAEKIGVLDRNYGADAGGVFCHEVRASLQGQGGKLVQSYLTGVGGGDVVPEMVDQVVADLTARSAASDPVWKGIES